MVAYFLNLFDCFATIFVLQNGGVEMNPVVATLIQSNPLVFPICKVFLAGFLIQWLRQNAKERPEAKQGLLAVTILYALLAIWHINSILFITIE